VTRPGIRSPEPLNNAHDLTSFDNGKHPSLDAWLRESAPSSEGLSARTYVICSTDPPNRVIGYYCISSVTEQRESLPSAKLRRSMPKTVPFLLIGRLAVDKSYQRLGLGTDMLRDALMRCVAIAEMAGVRGIIAQAIDDDDVLFYRRHGFINMPHRERLMLLPIETARAAI
jgi:GNAT superfamily N-acetyltransferase